MTEATLLPGPAAPDLLAALRAVAPSDGLARAAFDTWSTAQALGWDRLRSLRNRDTWYRHLDLLAQAGVSVPLGPYKGKRRSAAHKSPHVTTFRDLYRHVGRSFTVADAWEPEFYPEGTTGHVSALLFRDGVWCFELAYDGIPGGHDQLPIEQVLSRCTFSEGGPDAG